MIQSRFEIPRDEHIAPVHDIWTGEILDKRAVSAWARNAGVLTRVFCEREYWDDNVVSLEDARLKREVVVLTSHLGKSTLRPCLQEPPLARPIYITGQLPTLTELL